MPILVEVEGRGVEIEFPDGTPESRIRQIIAANFPPTGAEIMARSMADPGWASNKASLDEYIRMRTWKGEQDPDAFAKALEMGMQTVSEVGGGIWETVKGAPTSPLDTIGSVVLGAIVGTADLGLMADKTFNIAAYDSYEKYLAGEGVEDTREHKNAWQASMRDDYKGWQRQMDYLAWRMKAVDQAPNPEIVQGLSYILDPTLILGGVGLGGKLSAKVAAKAAVGAGKVAQGAGRGATWAGTLPERAAGKALGEGAEQVVREATSAKGLGTIAGGVGLVGGAPTLGLAAAPGLLKGTGAALRVGGEVTEAMGKAIGESGRMGVMSRAATLLPEGASQKLASGLRFMDQPLAYAGATARGVGTGAVVGGTLGGLSEGWNTPEMWGMVGGGLALGGMGGFIGKGVSDVSGITWRGQFAKDVERFTPRLNEEYRGNFERYAAEAPMEAAKAMDGMALTKRTAWHFVDREQARQVSDQPFYGMTKPRGDTGIIDVYINVDDPITQGRARADAVGDEFFHSLMLEEAGMDFAAGLKADLIGMEGVKEGWVDLKEIREFGEQYGKLLKDPEFNNQLDAALPRDAEGNVTVGDRAALDMVVEKFTARYFSTLLAGKPRDYLLDKGTMPLLRSAFHRAKEKFLSTTEYRLNSAGVKFDFAKKGIRGGFYNEKGKRIRVGALDRLLADFVRAERTGEIPKPDNSGTTDIFKLAGRQVDAGTVKLMKSQGAGHYLQTDDKGRVTRRKLDDVIAEEKAFSDHLLDTVRKDTEEGGSTIMELDKNFNPTLDPDKVAYYQLNMTPEAMQKILADPFYGRDFQENLAAMWNSIHGPGHIFDRSYWKVTQSGHKDKSQRVAGTFGMGQYKTRPYNILVNKRGGVYTRDIDWKLLSRRINNAWQKPAVRSMFNNDRVEFQGEFVKYLENLASPDPVRSATLFGSKKADLLKDVSGVRRKIELESPIAEFEVIGTNESLNPFKSFRIERTTRLEPTGEVLPFSEDVYGKIKKHYLPAAFHGSPHAFEKFTTKEMGAGEGAQTYGWGMYFAGKREVGQFYRDMFKKQEGKGHLYEVDLAPKDSELLHWDRSLKEQPAAVRDKLSDHFRFKDTVEARSGEDMYQSMASGWVPPGGDPFISWPQAKKAASLALRDAGIRGIKYLDEGSRNISLGSFAFDASGLNVYGNKKASLTRLGVEGLAKKIHGEKVGKEIRNAFDEYATHGELRSKLSEKAQDIWGRTELDELSHNYVIFDEADVSVTARYLPADQTVRAGAQDPLGMFSKAERAAVDLKQNKGTGQQMLAMLKKSGVKDEEIKALGLDKFLEGNRKVTKDEIIDHLVENQITVEETVLRDVSDEMRENLSQQMYGRTYNELNQGESGILNTQLYREGEPTKHGGESLQEPGAVEGSYRELLLRLPVQRGRKMSFDEYVAEYYSGLSELAESARARFSEEARRTYEMGLAGEHTGQSLIKGTGTYTGGHYGEYPNTLAHIRFNERTGPKGEKVLFIEEIQSDWHQEGRKKGYRGDFKEFKEKVMDAARRDGGTDIALVEKAFDHLAEEPLHTDARSTTREWQILQNAIGKEQIDLNFFHDKGDSSLVPGAPFKTSWHELAMKRMIKYATDNGYDAIAWTKGETQAARYDLSKHLSEVRYEKDNTGANDYDLIAYDHKGSKVFNEEHITLERIEELIGKEMAEKISRDEGAEVNEKYTYRNWKFFGKLDLKVGGEFHKNLYDRKLTRMKTWKKLGLKVEEGSFKDGGETYSDASVVALKDLSDFHANEGDVGASYIFRVLSRNMEWSDVSRQVQKMKKTLQANRLRDFGVTDKSWEIVDAELGKRIIPLRAHIVRLSPEVKAKVLDTGLARFLPAGDLPAGRLHKNQMGYTMIETARGTWRMYTPDGILIGVAKDQAAAVKMFERTHKAKLRREERSFKKAA